MTANKMQIKSDNPTHVIESEMAQPEFLNSLKNHLLIAMPSLTDPYFDHSVVYLCEHDEQGAMGFIINYPVKLTVQELLSNVEGLSYQPEPALTDSVFLGGPLALERGFVLHSPIADNSHSSQLNEQLMMSNSSNILSSLGTETAPEKYLVTLGYSSWETGQLEQELKDNHWLAIKNENTIIFNTPPEERWKASLQRLGVSPEQLSAMSGSA